MATFSAIWRKMRRGAKWHCPDGRIAFVGALTRHKRLDLCL
jgi:hypothetical protein